MARYYRKMIANADHLNPTSSPPWIVLWDTIARMDGDWSAVRTQTEADALERAAHLLKLGFVVHAIMDPAGTLVMDAQSIASRFASEKRDA